MEGSPSPLSLSLSLSLSFSLPSHAVKLKPRHTPAPQTRLTVSLSPLRGGFGPHSNSVQFNSEAQFHELILYKRIYWVSWTGLDWTGAQCCSKGTTEGGDGPRSRWQPSDLNSNVITHTLTHTHTCTLAHTHIGKNFTAKADTHICAHTQTTLKDSWCHNPPYTQCNITNNVTTLLITHISRKYKSFHNPCEVHKSPYTNSTVTISHSITHTPRWY